MARRSGLAALLLALPFAISACTPESGGYAAIYRDELGEWHAAVAMCEGRTDTVRLWPPRGPTPTPASFDRTWSWKAPGWIKDTATVSITNPPSDWTQVTGAELAPFDGFDQAGTYSLNAGSANNEWTTDGPRFTSDQLAELHPNQVLSGSAAVPDGSTVDYFFARACDNR